MSSIDPSNIEARARLGGALENIQAERGIGLSQVSRLLRPDLSNQPPPMTPPAPATPPTSATPPAQAQPPASPPVPTPPQAPPANVFAELTFPSPGDRIKAEDFRRLSQALRILSDAYALQGASFGYPFGQVKLALAAQQYEVARVVSVYGAELTNLGDPSLDDRKVLAVTPTVLGERRVAVVLTEQPAAVDSRRNMPDLSGLTYTQAQARLQSELGDLISGGGPINVPDLSGLTMTEATQRMSG